MSAIVNNAVAPAVAVPAAAAAPAADADSLKKVKRSLKKNVAPAEFGGPSRPKSPYMFFADDVRAATDAECRAACEKSGEAFKIVMVMKAIGDKWKLVSEEQKAAYAAKAAAAKAQYDVDVAAWHASADYKKFVKESALHKKKQADKKALVKAKESGMPQRPMAGYMSFTQEVRADCRAEIEKKGEKFTVQSLAPLVKARWNALGEAGQKVWHDKYAADKAAYETALKEWQESDAGKEYAKAKAVAAKRKQANQKVGKAAKKQKKNDGAAAEEQDDEEDVEEDMEAAVAAM